jgi:hypothetical protein
MRWEDKSMTFNHAQHGVHAVRPCDHCRTLEWPLGLWTIRRGSEYEQRVCENCHRAWLARRRQWHWIDQSGMRIQLERVDA